MPRGEQRSHVSLRAGSSVENGARSTYKGLVTSQEKTFFFSLARPNPTTEEPASRLISCIYPPRVLNYVRHVKLFNFPIFSHPYSFTFICIHLPSSPCIYHHLYTFIIIYPHLSSRTCIHHHLPLFTFIHLYSHYRHLPSCTFIYLHLLPFRFIYLHLPSITFIYVYLPSFTFICVVHSPLLIH